MLHRSGGERRPADDVARSEDVLDCCPVVGTDGDPTALIGLQARTLELEVLRLPLATGGVEDDLRGDLLPACELRQRALGVALYGGHLFTQAEDDTDVTQVVLQTLSDLGVAELEQAHALLDDRDLCAERSEHRGVLDADHSCPDNDNGVRDPVEVEQAVGVEDRPVVEFHLGRVRRARPGGDDHPVGTDPPLFVTRHQNGVRVEEVSAPMDDLDVVPQQLVADDVDLAVDDAPAFAARDLRP